MERIPDSKWTPEDGIHPVDLEWRAERSPPWLASLFRQTADSQRLGELRAVLRCRRRGWWCVGWM